MEEREGMYELKRLDTGNDKDEGGQYDKFQDNDIVANEDEPEVSRDESGSEKGVDTSGDGGQGILATTQPTTRWFQTLANLIKSIVGAGIFALPHAIFRSGLIIGGVGLIAIAFLTAFTSNLLLDCKKVLVGRLEVSMRESEKELQINSTGFNDDQSDGATDKFADFVKVIGNNTYASYEDIGRAAWGTKGVWLSNFVVITSQMGFCCTYVLFIAENIAPMLVDLGIFGNSDASAGSSSTDFSGSTSASDSSSHQIQVEASKWQMAATIGMLLPFFILISWIRNTKSLAPVSIFGNFAILTGLISIAVYGFSNLEHNRIGEVPLLPEKPTDFLFFFGASVFTFECINVIIPFEASAENPQSFPKLAVVAISIMGFVYLIFSMIVLICFGSSTLPVLTLNLPPSIITIIVKIVVCMALFCSYPLQLYPVFKIFERNWNESVDDFTRANWRSKHFWKVNLLRAFLVLMTATISLIVPYFGLFINLVGSFSNSTAAFILPPFFYLKVAGDEITVTKKIWLILIIVFGIAASVCSCTITIFDIVQAFAGQDQ